MQGKKAPISFARISALGSVMLALALYCGKVRAEYSEAESESKEGKWEKSFITGNIAISEWFDGVAEGVDLFLAGQQYTTKQNKTAFLIEPSFYYNEKEGYNDAFAFNFNLRLPNVEEYWQITFTSYDETKERGISQTYLRQTPRERDYGATLGFFRKLGDVKASFQPRISFAGSFLISHTLTFESVVERGKNYRVNPKMQFYADADKGTGIFLAFNFAFQLSQRFNLTFVNEGDYEDRAHLFTVTNGVALGQWFSKVTNMSYNIFVTSKNRPNYQMKSYNLGVAWSRILYKNMLDVQVIPNVDFADQYDYVGNPGITLNFNLKF